MSSGTTAAAFHGRLVKRVHVLLTAAALTPDGPRVPSALVVMAAPPALDVPRRESTARVVQTADLDPGDADLLSAIAGGEHPALLALYDRYSGISYGLAYRILQERGAAEEAVQDAYLRVWHRAATFDPTRGCVRPWLLTIVHHCAIDLVRRRGGMPRADVSFDEMIDQHAASDTWAEVSQRDDQARVRAAVASLPHAQRRAIELAFFADLTHREIAEREDVPLGTVKGRMRLGLQRLSHLLADPE
jgi:RNA polymerase sigma-70 factor (ECF subfamily)